MSSTNARVPAAPVRSSRADPIVLGAVLLDRYRVKRRIGEGAMGEVYECEHIHVGRKVALKVLKASVGNEVALRFRAEARAASAAGHPNIVDVLDAGELDDGRPYIAMEYLAGRTIYETIVASGKLRPQRAVDIALAIARALQAAHDVGVVHRDLKSDNVMLTFRGDDEGVKVVDFGIAHAAVKGPGRTTREGFAMGTPEYMAPEQADGRPATPRFDIYALGVVLYEMLSGRPPIEAETPLQLVVRKTTHDSPSLREAQPGLPSALIDLVDACLRRDPDRRPQTANAVADALAAIDAVPRTDRLAAPVVSPAPEPSPVSSTALDVPGQRGRAVAAWVVGGVLLIVALLLWGRGRWFLDAAPAHDAAAKVAAGSAERSETRLIVPPPAELPAAAEVPAKAPADVDPPAVVDTAAEEPVASPPAPDRPRVARRVPAPPAPSVTPEPTPPAAVASGVDCKGVEDHAREARRSHLWDALMREVDKRACWTSQAERRKLRVLALKETGKFAACVEAATGSSDAEVQAWRTMCSKRVAQGAG